jgi:hypothetical protein
VWFLTLDATSGRIEHIEIDDTRTVRLEGEDDGCDAADLGRRVRSVQAD